MVVYMDPLGIIVISVITIAIILVIIINSNTVEARKLEHHYPHALKVKHKGS